MSTPSLFIGWTQADITPKEFPVLVTGQFPARLSEGVEDRLTATALAFGQGEECVVFVSLDLICVPDALRDQFRSRIAKRLPEIDAQRVLFNATHTHTAPEIRIGKEGVDGNGIELGEAPVALYTDFLADTIADLVTRAWGLRQPGSIAYGLDYAAVARNRRWVDRDEVAYMYRLNAETANQFRHIEGYEDHSLNLLATYDPEGKLTGLIVNLACPSQETEGGYRISADYWCETREELRKRFGENLFILPQCSAAGDLTSHRLTEKRANDRMQQLRNRSNRREIALRITEAVDRILPAIEKTRENAPRLQHRMETVEIPLNRLTPTDASQAGEQAENFRKVYEEEKARVEADPSLREQPRWYLPVSRAWRTMLWHRRVIERYEAMQTQSTQPAQIHIVRLGDIAFASNPFEYYVDFGMQIKLRSPALQTFLIQLAGAGTYVPSPRSVAGGGYGSVPASNPIGPEGGQILAERTLENLNHLFCPSPSA